jgi:hypothetical protein
MINYRILAFSQEFYEKKGFKIVETPWTVTQAVVNITKPINVADDFYMPAKKKSLVGSAEQGFLYLYLKDFLPKGKFQSISPCFRDDSFDFLHTKYFMKNELIITDEVNEESLKSVIKHALSFFETYISKKNLTVHKSPDSDSTDIFYTDNVNCYELGSYGIRSCQYLDWVYGTACAEPRLSRIIQLQNKELKNQ